MAAVWGNWPLRVSQCHFLVGLIEPQMISTESGLRAMSNQLLMNSFDGTESIVPEQQKVGTSSGWHHAVQEPFPHTEVLCLQCNP